MSSESIDYMPVQMGEWKHQVTVTTYPGRIAAWFGAKPRQRVFLSDFLLSDGTSHWYESPNMDELIFSDMGLHRRIERAVRRQQIEEAKPT